MLLVIHWQIFVISNRWSISLYYIAVCRAERQSYRRQLSIKTAVVEPGALKMTDMKMQDMFQVSE